MQEKINIEDLIKNVVKEDGLETPSNGFLNNVMSAVMEVNEKPLTYKPLISKYVLAAIFSGVTLIILFLFRGELNQAGNNYPYIDKMVNSLQIFHFDFPISSQISYIITSALIMLMIQVALIGTIYKKIHR